MHHSLQAKLLCWYVLLAFATAVNELPEFAIVNFEVEKANDGPDDDDGEEWVEFHRWMKASPKQAYILQHLEDTGKKHGFFRRAPVYRAKRVSEDRVNLRADEKSGSYLASWHIPGTSSVRTLLNSHEKVLLYLHGFNVVPKYVLEQCAKYSREHNRLVIPIIWRSERTGLFGWFQDRILRAPAAAESFCGKLEIAKHVRKSLLCHSMGNFVLRLMARTTTGGASDEYYLPFEEIFMVAADVSHDLFDASQNNHTNQTLNDGLEIVSMTKHQVHVLHSHKDKAMWARFISSGGIKGLGADGYRNTTQHPLHPDIRVKKKLIKFDFSCFSGNQDKLLHHNYQFTDRAIDYYEKNMTN